MELQGALQPYIQFNNTFYLSEAWSPKSQFIKSQWLGVHWFIFIQVHLFNFPSLSYKLLLFNLHPSSVSWLTRTSKLPFHPDNTWNFLRLPYLSHSFLVWHSHFSHLFIISGLYDFYDLWILATGYASIPSCQLPSINVGLKNKN